MSVAQALPGAPAHPAGTPAGERGDVLASAQAGPRAVRGGALRVGGFLVASLFNAGAAALLFRHLGTVIAGRYVLIATLVSIVAGFSDLGLSQMGIRELSVTGIDERPGLARDLLGLRIVLSLVGLALMMAFAVVAYSTTIVLGVAIAGAGLLLQVIQDNYGVMLQVELRIGWVAALEVIRQLAIAAGISLLVLLGAHLLAFVSVTAWACTVSLAFAVALVRGSRSLLPAFDRSRGWRLMRMVLPYSAAIMATTLYFREAIVLVSLLSSGYQLGLYGAAFRVIEVLAVIPAMVVGAALPILARAASEDRVRFDYAIGRVFEVSVVVGGGLAVVIGVGAPLVIAIIGGGGYRAASGVLAVEGVALGASFLGALWGTVLLSQGRYRELVALNVGAMLALAPVVGVLVSLDGAQGAAIAMAAMEVAVALTGGWVACRGGRVARVRLGVVAKVALAGAVGAAPALLLGVPDLVRMILAGALYGGVVLLLRALPGEVGALLPPRARGWAARMHLLG